MKRLVLNPNEAAVLTAFTRDSVHSIPEIAVYTKLTPSQVKEGIAGLSNRKFVKPVKDYDLVRLTRLGSSATRDLTLHPNAVVITS